MPTKYWDVSGHALYLHYAGATTLPGIAPDFGRGRRMLFIHAAGSNGHNWHHQIDHFGAAHSPLAFDFPGHGRSTGLEGFGSIREYADFTAALMDSLAMGSAVIVGRAMGAIIAMDFAARHPARVEALVLVAASAKLNLGPDRLEAMRAVAVGRAAQAFTNAGFSPATIANNVGVIRESWMEQVKTDPRVRYTDLVACDKTDLRGDIDKISNPTMILAGADDAITTPADAEGIGSKIKGAKIEVIADGGHALPWEKPAEVNAAFDNFLAGLK